MAELPAASGDPEISLPPEYRGLAHASSQQCLPRSHQGSRPPEHSVRAPTLMAGEAPGSQGSVLVWAPEKRLIRRKVAGLGVAAAACAAGLWALHSSALWLWLITTLPFPVLLVVMAAAAAAITCLFRYSWSTLAALPALSRPCYLTTDDAGIGITTWSGSQALRWDDVRALARYDRYCTVFLYRASGHAAMINTTGFSPEAVEELCALAAQRANLSVRDRNRWRRLLFWGGYSCRLRAGYRLAYPDTVIPDAAPLLPPDGNR